MEALTYVYVLCDPVTNNPRYVGITWNPPLRFSHHCNATTRLPISAWIKAIRPAVPKILLLDPSSDREGAKAREVELIRVLREEGADLLNVTDGGDDCTVSEWNAEHRQHLRDAVKEMYERMTPETKALRSQRIWETRRRNGTTHTNKGFRFSEAEREENGCKLREALAQRSDEAKALWYANMCASVQRTDVQEKKRQSMLATLAQVSPEERARRVALTQATRKANLAAKAMLGVRG